MEGSKKGWSLSLKIGGILLGVVTLGVLFHEIDTGKALDLISGLGFSGILIFLPYIVVSMLDTLGWKAVFGETTQRINFGKLMKIRIIAEAMMMSIPAGVAVAETVKPVLLKRWLGVPTAQGVASVAIKKMLLGFAQGIYLGLCATFGYGMLKYSSQSVIGFDGLPWIVVLASLIFLLFFGIGTYIFINGDVAARLHKLLIAIPIKPLRIWLVSKETKFEEIDQQLSAFHGMGKEKAILSVVYFTLGWLMETMETFVILWVLGVDLSYTDVLAFETILSLIRSIVFFIPAGLGIQDFGYVAFLTAFGVADPLAVGGAFILLKRFKELLWIALGYLLLVITGVRLKEIAVQTS
ncbi:conserved hypothetical protein [Chloroherpeton thalassium ATCC 35110]|uniref:Uncharacterized protein n=1 Tax=Chloroherpeton thalassium (strain ATCC 35110 / GB-78) TaxID=517418 RepID=B3QVD8_CHLT3|nr:lysylphosphatidylglycerol synthase transmembrane domain-containing protein [Chloroherpeton thalassium]ACF14538.1 conserved hypothetical protein [Chloroherpeton thalassium ATCC 35110]